MYLKRKLLSLLQRKHKYHLGQTEGTIIIIANLSMFGREPLAVIFGDVSHRPIFEHLY